ncbi:MAG: cyclase family protein [Desulforhopalus sp.]
MLNWITVSLPISEEMAVYKNLIDKRPVIENTRNFSDHGMYESSLHLPLHTGTHVDYPLHAISGGKCSSDYECFPAEFDAYVVDVTGSPSECLGPEHIQNIPMQELDAVFFKTRATILREFDPLFPWLTGEAAALLTGHAIKFVGIDQPGIERNQPAHETHIQLLERDILIIEGLDLSRIEGGKHHFRAFTLNVKGVEAEPVMIYAAPD